MTDLENLQKEIFDKISNNKAEELQVLLSTNKIDVNFVDENGMSPLQHACYKGNKGTVQMLLDHGADPNECQHEHQYTALHFAALSGNADLCHLLMSYGAKMHATNSVGRTPSQMAAFVGNHHCVSTINNFIPKADIDYYITPHGLQTGPMLHPYLADSFHSFIIQVNVHPVKVIMNLQKHPALLDNLHMIQKVLEAMRHREMTRGIETNEIMAFKYHYLSCIVAEVSRAQKRQSDVKDKKDDEKKENEEKTKEKKVDAVELIIKKFLKHESYMETFLKLSVRDFDYRDSAIFRQMLATLASSDPPSAISVVTAAINGQRGFNDNALSCVTCGEEKASKTCSKCKSVQYCDKECQRLHWFIHKETCKSVQRCFDISSIVLNTA